MIAPTTLAAERARAAARRAVSGFARDEARKSA